MREVRALKVNEIFMREVNTTKMVLFDVTFFLL